MNAGKWLILGVFGVALASGIAAWTHRYYRTDEVQRLWGAKRLELIANAPVVEAIPPGGGDAIDITGAKGMLSIRYMLGSDFAYAPLEEKSVETTPHWSLIFRNGDERVRFDFTPDCSLMWTPDPPQSRTQLVPAAAANLRTFFEEQ